MTFEMASDSIEINGLPYHDAFEMEQEYEPLNEELRQQADELHGQIQDTLVKLSGMLCYFTLCYAMLICDDVLAPDNQFKPINTCRIPQDDATTT